MIEATSALTTDIALLEAMNDNVADQLEAMAAGRILELMKELAPDEVSFFRAIRVPRPGPYGDATPILVEEEIAALMRKHPALVGVMFGRYMYDLSDREDETQKAANAMAEAGLFRARQIWDARAETAQPPSP